MPAVNTLATFAFLPKVASLGGSGRREESPPGSSSPDRRLQAARPVSRDAGALREASARGRICAAMTNLPADAGKANGGS